MPPNKLIVEIVAVEALLLSILRPVSLPDADPMTEAEFPPDPKAAAVHLGIPVVTLDACSLSDLSA